MIDPCVVIPFYRHGEAIGHVLAAVRKLGMRCYLVDDGSGPDCAPLLDRLLAGDSAWLRVIRHETNRGKGAAVMTGFAEAAAAGHSHAIQIDADGQHDVEDLPRMLALAQAHPGALIAGTPVYDESVPRSRLYGRWVTHVWVWIHTWSLSIRDSMCGFRVYPLAPTLRICRTQTVGRRMDFDTEIMVRLYWAEVPVIELPTRVCYPSGGVSHFHMWHDNVRITRMHARLFFGMLWRIPALLARKLRRRSALKANSRA